MCGARAPERGDRITADRHVRACQTVSYGGRTFIMYRQGVKCSYARRWVKRLHRTKHGPKRWDCSSGSNFRTGGYCERGSRHFGWHPAD